MKTKYPIHELLDNGMEVAELVRHLDVIIENGNAGTFYSLRLDLLNFPANVM